jgi:hypothetical protein
MLFLVGVKTMKNQIIRFGAEFELIDSEAKRSAYEARKEFFDILIRRKPQVFSELLDLFSLNSVPEEFQNHYPSLDYLTRVFRRDIEKSILLKIPWIDAGFSPDIAETPLVYYFDYLSRKKTKFERLFLQVEKEWNKYEPYETEEHIKREALKLLIPDWKTLLSDTEAKELCSRLTIWAKKYNIFEDWILNFALLILRKAKISIDSIPVEDIETTRNQYYLSYFHYEYFKDSTLRKALGSYVWGELNPDPFNFSKEPSDTLKFEFNRFDLEINDRWFPLVTTQQEFVKRVQNEFFKQRFQQFELDLSESGDFESFAKTIEKTNDINKQFALDLKEYCLKVRKQQPPEATKTPEIRTGSKYFHWLVDFQVNHPDETTYESIAKENSTDSKTVRYGIKNAAKIIDLKLRPAKRTGRPKGIIETKERGNYLDW